jgi:hypothetical protein
MSFPDLWDRCHNYVEESLCFAILECDSAFGGDKAVSVTDIINCQVRSGQLTIQDNFRFDVNYDGYISVIDIINHQIRSGNGVSGSCPTCE